MDEKLISTILAEISLICFGLVALTIIFFCLSRISRPIRGAWLRFRDIATRHGLKLAFLIALFAMLGSLYYSEGAGFLPCEFCWYQRIGIYPLSLLLLVAMITRDNSVRKYVIPLTIATAGLSIWNILLERVPSLEGTASQCKYGVPCSTIWVEVFGFVTIPVMALSITVTICTIMILMRSNR